MSADAAKSRAKLACVRCKARKRKCSGGFPCSSCTKSNTECAYPRKPKKVFIYDTELDELKSTIDSLNKELGHLRAAEMGIGRDMNLSIFLSSGSCELICWNIKQFMTSSKGYENISKSPEFSSFIEEDTYDAIIFDNEREVFSKNVRPIEALLQDITYDEVKADLDNVILFLNTGYLTIDPIDFRATMKSYYDKNGFFKPIDNSEMDYFVLELLMILALGRIYSLGTCISATGRQFTQVPGIEYFKLAISYLPSNFQVITLQRDKIKDTFRIIELYGLIAIYARILDKKNASSILTSYALQLCISLNLHKGSTLNKNMRSFSFLLNTESYKVFWSSYCLNRFYASRIGQPLLLNYKDITINTISAESAPKTLDEFSNFSSMKFYVELARIAELITIEIYGSTASSRTYLNSILKILSMLVDWISTIPEHLKLDISTSSSNPNSRLIFSLHFNYLHHIYLTCVPIMLHFVKSRIQLFKKGVLPVSPFDFKVLPSNISGLLSICIKASQITTSIFMALLHQQFVRVFGFTEIDYLYSSSLIFIICLTLDIKEATELEINFDKNLEITLNLLNEMYKRGNRVAGSKLNQILDLLDNLSPILKASGYDLESMKKNYQEDIWTDTTAANNFHIDFDELFQDDSDIFSMREEDLAYMTQVFDQDF